MAGYYLPYMEIRDSRLVFPVLFLTLLFPVVNSGFTLCTTTADCDSSLEFCDTDASGTCMSCKTFPCLKTYLEKNGDAFCRNACPEYWENNVQNTMAPFLPANKTKLHEEGDVQKLVKDNAEEAQKEDEKTAAVRSNMVYILTALAVVVAICVIVGSVIWVYYRKKNVHRSQEETSCETGELVTGQE